MNFYSSMSATCSDTVVTDTIPKEATSPAPPSINQEDVIRDVNNVNMKDSVSDEETAENVAFLKKMGFEPDQYPETTFRKSCEDMAHEFILEMPTDTMAMGRMRRAVYLLVLSGSKVAVKAGKRLGNLILKGGSDKDLLDAMREAYFELHDLALKAQKRECPPSDKFKYGDEDLKDGDRVRVSKYVKDKHRGQTGVVERVSEATIWVRFDSDGKIIGCVWPGSPFRKADDAVAQDDANFLNYQYDQKDSRKTPKPIPSEQKPAPKKLNDAISKRTDSPAVRYINMVNKKETK